MAAVSRVEPPLGDHRSTETFERFVGVGHRWPVAQSIGHRRGAGWAVILPEARLREWLDRSVNAGADRDSRWRRPDVLERTLPQQRLCGVRLLAQGHGYRSALSVALGCLAVLPTGFAYGHLRRHGRGYPDHSGAIASPECRIAGRLRSGRRIYYSGPGFHAPGSRDCVVLLPCAA